MNFWKSFALALTGVVVLAIPTRAEINPNGQSVLCKQKGWLTEIAISSPEFVVAICIDKNLPFIAIAKVVRTLGARRIPLHLVNTQIEPDACECGF